MHIIDLAACVRKREREGERGERYVCVRVCLPCTCQKKLFTLFKFRNKGNSKSNKCSLAFSSRKPKNGRCTRREGGGRECEKWIASRCVYGQWANWFSIGNLYSCYLLGEFKLKQMNSQLRFAVEICVEICSRKPDKIYQSERSEDMPRGVEDVGEENAVK